MMEATKLNKILLSLINKPIKRLEIAGNKLFPVDNGALTLRKNGTDGYYNIVSQHYRSDVDLIICCIGLRGGTLGDYKSQPFMVSYNKLEEIDYIVFDKFKLHF